MLRRRLIIMIAVLIIAALVLIFLGPVTHWIHGLWWPESGEGYAIGSSWAGCSVIGAGFTGHFLGFWHRHNCHVQGCPRVGRHPLAGGQYVVCTKHLKETGFAPQEVTVDHVARAHHAHLSRVPGHASGDRTAPPLDRSHERPGPRGHGLWRLPLLGRLRRE